MKPPTRKRARVDSDVTESDAAPRTRQRLSSNASKPDVASQTISKSVDDVLQRMIQDDKDDAIRVKPTEISTRLRIPSNYRAPVLNVGRSLPAAAVLTQVDTIMSPPSESQDTMPPTTSQLPAKGFSRKSPHITRTNYPAIPSKWDSNAFPVMKPGLLEYHNRFRDADLAKPKKELSSRIIPEGLLPPPVVYEPEADDDFEDSDILFHITPPLTDHWGNILEVSARHLEMSITLEDKKGFVEFWDLDHTGIVHVGVPAFIHFTLIVDEEDESLLTRAIPPRPDFRCIDISCESFEYHTKVSCSASPEYAVKYCGATVSGSKNISPEYGLTAGILMKKKWGKMFPSPATRVSDRRSCVPRLSLSSSSSSDSGGETSSDESPKEDKKKGWFLKVWVPIPLELFRKKESRAFRIKAAAWLGDERCGGILTAETDMVLSHLRSHREMEQW